MRLIDADALITKIKELAKRVQHNPDTCNGLGGAVAIIMEMPTIEEHKTGKWVRLESGSDGCNQCWENDFGWARFNYCPNCGAKMEGAEE